MCALHLGALALGRVVPVTVPVGAWKFVLLVRAVQELEYVLYITSSTSASRVAATRSTRAAKGPGAG